MRENGERQQHDDQVEGQQERVQHHDIPFESFLYIIQIYHGLPPRSCPAIVHPAGRHISGSTAVQ